MIWVSEYSKIIEQRPAINGQIFTILNFYIYSVRDL